MKLSEATLARNLEALRTRDPELAARLELPVESDHVVLDAPGGPLYQPHLSGAPLTLDADAVWRAVAEAGAGPLLVFGVGLGELVDTGLARGAGEVLAWDRDPWLWRVALAAHDWSDALRSGALRPFLGVDVLDLPAPDVRVFHPLLGRVYGRERALLERGANAPRRAILCAGGLFVDQVGAALERRGYGLYTLDVERLAVEELDRTLARFEPELVVSINYREGLAGFCRERGRRLVCWEIDPSTSFLPPNEGRGGGRTEGAADAWIFTYRDAHVDAFRAAGFAHVEYLPLAADAEVRRPVEIGDVEIGDAETGDVEVGDAERYAAPVSFVGTSMVENATPFMQRFAAGYARWKPDATGEEVHAFLTTVLQAQERDLWAPCVDTVLEDLAPGFRAAMRASGAEDPAVLVGELAASTRRLTTIRTLAPHGVEVWGDEGWRRLEPDGVRYRGLAGHTSELNRIYSGSRVNLDLGRLFQADIVTMRVFDVLACGGFVLTENNPALVELFDPERDLATYADGAHLALQVERFLADPDEAKRRAEHGRQTVLERHTIDARVGYMLARVAGAGPSEVAGSGLAS